MRSLLAWTLFYIGRAYLKASQYVQGNGRGPWLPPAPDFRHQLNGGRVAAND